jgi:effector-binding domain-containing protein
MGNVLGKITVETPNFKLVESFPNFQVREYPPLLKAQTHTTDTSDAFRKLARYIGVFGTAENSGKADSTPQPIAMTAPVVFAANEKTIIESFILPADFTMETVPDALSKDISIVQEPTKKVAVVTFAGYWDVFNVKPKVDQLLADIESNGLKIKEPLKWEMYRYNDPFCLGPFRKNEVAIELD